MNALTGVWLSVATWLHQGRVEEGERVGLPMTRLKTWSLGGTNTRKGFALHRRIFLSFLMDLLSGLFTRMSCHFVYTALTELIAAFTGCSSKYKPVLTAFYQQKMFMLPSAAVELFPVTQCTLCTLIKCIHKSYSEIMGSLLKGLDGKAYNHILISE